MVKFVNKQVYELFNVSNAKSSDAGKLTLLDQGKYEFVGRSITNNGIQGYLDQNLVFKPNPANTIAISQIGQQMASFHELPWYASQNMFVLESKDLRLNPLLGLFFTTIFNCQLKRYGSYRSYPTQDEIKNWKIQVPVTPDDKLDTEYMTSYVRKIEAYLAVLGYKSLADCQLNQHDLDVLHAKPEMKKFKVENLLYKVELKWHGNHKFDKLADTSESKTKEFNLPLLNAKHGNNGIMFYGRKDEWDQAKNIIDVVSNGAVATGDVYFQTSNISVMWDAYALNTKQTVSAKAKEYIATSLKKAIKLIFGWENKAVWSKVRNIKITLPVTASGTPDWQFMEDYITAIEKLKVIKIKQYLDQKLLAYQELIR